MIKKVWDYPASFWALISLPGIWLLYSALTGANLEALLHPTGEFSARFMIVAMMLTPLRMLLPKTRAIGWLLKRRRYLG